MASQITHKRGKSPSNRKWWNETVLELRDVINYFIISGRNLENHPLEQLMKIINMLKKTISESM